MVYVENTSHYRQKVYIPKDEASTSTTHTYQFQNKDYDIDHNGEYYIEPDPGYDGISAGTITVHVPTDTQEAYDQGYRDGYSSGVTDGEETQKAKLEPLTATTNGYYTRDDGYSEVFVEVETGGGYDQGYHDGEAAQKAKLEAFTATTNGHYTREDGWNDLVVEVPQTGTTSVLVPLTADTNQTYFPAAYSADGFSEVSVHVDTQPYYDQGYQDGQDAQKALLGTLSADTNGTYTSETGYSAVTVNVPITGETYPRSNVTANIYSNDYEGLSGMTINFYNNGSHYSAFTFTDSATTAFTATYNPGVEYAIKATPPAGYQGRIDYQYITLWNMNPNHDFYIDRYDGNPTTVYLYTDAGSASTFSNNDMAAIVYSGNTSGWTTPSSIIYDDTNERWELTYPGAVVEGFQLYSGTTLRDDITRIETPDSLYRIYGFRDCTKLQSVYGVGLTEIGKNDFYEPAAFRNCTALTNVESNAPVTIVGADALSGCVNLVNFPMENIEYGWWNNFANCTSLVRVELHNIIQFGSNMFMNCTGIETMIIGKNCTSIGASPFDNCTSLTEIWCFATTAPGIVTNPFDSIPSSGTLYIPSGADYSSWRAKLPSGWSVVEFS